jgi:hypothetical protein
MSEVSFYDINSVHTITNLIIDWKPLEKPTILDYRNFADRVQRFDPGPWTTHQSVAPVPEPEETLNQLRGMADLIRNENDYTSDTALHSLPDDFMILAWAMKSFPGYELSHE